MRKEPALTQVLSEGDVPDNEAEIWSTGGVCERGGGIELAYSGGVHIVRRDTSIYLQRKNCLNSLIRRNL